MITLDYNVFPSWTVRESEPELASADETHLRYYLLLGDIVFNIEGHDFSPTWDRISVVDFAASLRHIVDELSSKNEVESILDFTDSDATLRFKRDGEVVTISADYAPGKARVSCEEFKSPVESFVARVGRELCDQYPSLRCNETSARLLPVPAI